MVVTKVMNWHFFDNVRMKVWTPGSRRSMRGAELRLLAHHCPPPSTER